MESGITPVEDKDNDADSMDADTTTTEQDEQQKKGKLKEYYIKTIVGLLYLLAKNLSPKAVSHRKMLVRYVTLNKINLHQLPVALHYLRKVGNGIIDQEDFEKECGVGKSLYFYNYMISLNSSNTHRTLLRSIPRFLLEEAPRPNRDLPRQRARTTAS